jgi:hypothetical protein
MKIAIMQPYMFPYIGYYQLINCIDKFIILDDVNFIMRGWINRNRILVNGEGYLFTAPLKNASQNKKIAECELVEGQWRGKLLKTIEFSYKKAPNFNQVYDLIKDSIFYPNTNLSDWLTYQIKSVCDFLKIRTQISNSNEVYQNTYLQGQERLIDICKAEKADHYINPIGGMGLYDKDSFRNSMIVLNFLRTKTITYKQFKGDFIPYLSILDVMMFNGRDEISRYLNEYELV